MTNLPERKQQTQETPVEIVAIALRVLKTRDQIDISSELIEERARNIVAALDIEASGATVIAALLDDPLDPGARAFARAWLRDVRSVSPGVPR